MKRMIVLLDADGIEVERFSTSEHDVRYIGRRVGLFVEVVLKEGLEFSVAVEDEE